MIGKVRKAKLYIFVGRLAKLHTVELGTSRLKGDGTNPNPLTRAGYRTEYYLVQKLPSTKYYKVVALKYGILGSTKYSLTIVSTHCDCLITINLTTLKQFISGHFPFLKVSCERLGSGASFL